jgi:hypothetical protein
VFSKKNISLHVLFWLYCFIICLAHYLKPDTKPDSILTGISGDLIISAISGIVFFVIGSHFQEESNFKLNELHEELMEQNALRNYDRMVNFLKTGSTYNFLIPDFQMHDGGWFSYSMKGKAINGDAVCFSSKIHKEYVIYIEDIAHRSVLDEEKLSEYVYGPLKVGHCYYLRFSDGKWHIELDTEYRGKKKIEISWYGKFGGVYSKPDANSLFFNSKPETTIIENFIYSLDGEESNSGFMCEIHKNTEDQFFLRLDRDGELKRLVVTFKDGDYQQKNPFLKIEKVEGYFSSIAALDKFKNIVSTKITNKGLSIPEIEFYRDKIKGQ